MELRGIGALVTGASRGLGAAVAKELASAGARVVLVARNPDELNAAVDAIRDGEAHGLVADIGDKHAIYPLAGAASALVGDIDVVVHAASTLGHVPLRPFLDTECEAIERAFAVNVLGPFRLTKILAANMALRGKGLVMFVTSDASVAAYPTWGAYGITKAALDHMGRIWGAELEGTGVRIVNVDPGEMDTKMHADAMPDADRSALLDPAVVARRIVALMRGVEGLPNGARVEASQWAAAAE